MDFQEILSVLLSFAGGLGLFIYGMHVMAEGLQKSAGEKTRKILGALTNNRLVGVAAGALITAIIQSSSATTVMVVGFVNAQILSLSQAVGVIMGANIGTTMTGWIVSMSEWATLLKPSTLAPVFLVAGCMTLMMAKSDRIKEIAKVAIGFSLLFIGLDNMSAAIKPYANSPIFYQAFTVIGSNPLFGLAVGALVTAIIQSSSASMGILQTLALNGVVNWSSAVFIALGQNIGTCVTAMLSCIGTNKNAQRAAIIHLLFNVIGAAIIGTICWVGFMVMPSLAMSNVSSTGLAIFHTTFNIATTLILLPFANKLVSLSEYIDPSRHKEKAPLVKLDSRMLSTPALSVTVIRNEIQKMADLVMTNIRFSRDVLIEHNHFDQLDENEKRINRYQKDITNFITDIDGASLIADDQKRLNLDMLVIVDLERIADHCHLISEEVQKEIELKSFSEEEIEDINTISSYCYDSVRYSMSLFKNFNEEDYSKIIKAKEYVENSEEMIRQKNLNSMQEKTSSVDTSLLFLDALYNYRRIVQHSKNLADYAVTLSQIND